jgi:hypothetical protein
LEALKRTAALKLAEMAGVFVDAGSAIVSAFNEGGMDQVVDLVGDKFGEAIDWLSSTGIPTLREKLGEFFAAMKTWVSENGADIIKDFLKWAVDALPQLVIELGKLNVEIIKFFAVDLPLALAGVMADLAADALKWLVDAAADAPAEAGNLIGAVVGFLTSAETFKKLADAAGDVAAQLLRFAGVFVESLPGQMQLMIDKIYELVTGWARDLGNLVVFLATELGGFAAEFIRRLPGWAADIIRNITSSVIGWGTQLVNLGALVVSKIAEGLAGLASAIWNKIKSAWNWARDQIGSLPAIRLVINLATSITGPVKNLIPNPENITKLPGAIWDVLPGS